MSSQSQSPFSDAYRAQYRAVSEHLTEDPAAVGDERDPPRAFFRPNQLVIAKSDLDEAEGHLRDQFNFGLERLNKVTPFGYKADNEAESRHPLNYGLYEARDGLDAREIVGQLKEREPGLRVGLNHMLFTLPYVQSSVGPPAPARDPGPPMGDAGANVWIGVVDTGVWPQHPWLVNRVAPASTLALDREEPQPLDPLPAQAGHGTFVGGIIRRAAPAARVVMAGAMDPWGYASDADIAAAITALIQANVKIVNLSVGGYTVDDLPPVAIASVLQTVPPDVAVVAAAGNKGKTRPLWPAAASGVLAVGALDGPSGEPAAWSNRGEWVDASAPGVDLVSSYFGSPSDPARVTLAATGAQAEFRGFATWSGTSFAAPQLAGAIGAEMSRSPGTSARVAAAKLLSTGRVVRGLGTEFAL
jgi:Subtilase family